MGKIKIVPDSNPNSLKIMLIGSKAKNEATMRYADGCIVIETRSMKKVICLTRKKWYAKAVFNFIRDNSELISELISERKPYNIRSALTIMTGMLSRLFPRLTEVKIIIHEKGATAVYIKPARQIYSFKSRNVIDGIKIGKILRKKFDEYIARGVAQ